MSGWIKLHRQIVSSSKFADPDILRLWILCLTKAAHKETTAIIEKQEIPLLPGQFVTGRFALQTDYNAMLAPRKKVKDTTLWSWLKRLEEWGDLDIKSTNKFSVITVLKWTDYQESLTTERQQTDNSLTTERQQTDTNKNVKNLEKVKKVEEINHNTFSVYTSNTHLQDALKSFVEFRKKIKKPMTEKAISLLVGNLDKLSENDGEKIEILEQSILNGWQGVFELKKVSGGVPNGPKQYAAYRNGGDKHEVNGRDAKGFDSSIDYGF